jgi:hypothetical protein
MLYGLLVSYGYEPPRVHRPSLLVRLWRKLWSM